MDTTTCAEIPSGSRAALPDTVLYILRCDGLAITALTLLLYARHGGSWWLFAALWFAPDLSILGYLLGPFWGSRIYNSIHAYATPTTLGVCALLLHSDPLVLVALIWMNHIAFDRALGYGLKYPSGFNDTHMGRLRRKLVSQRS